MKRDEGIRCAYLWRVGGVWDGIPERTESAVH